MILVLCYFCAIIIGMWQGREAEEIKLGGGAAKF